MKASYFILGDKNVTKSGFYNPFESIYYEQYTHKSFTCGYAIHEFTH